MRKFTIVVLDTTGIQSYIFSSNRLRENIGASHLLTQVTQDWVDETLEGFSISKLQRDEPIETSESPVELIYAGGGNTVLLFKSLDFAKRFTKTLSKRVLLDAPGINLIVAYAEFNWDEKSKLLYEVIQDLMKDDLESKKYERIPSAPLLGLGVTASCNSTQLVAVDTSKPYINAPEEDIYLISTEIRQKLKAVDRANQKLREIFDGCFDQNTYIFPYRTDHLGRSMNESSYVAVVHADGNGMGKRFREYGIEQAQDSENPNRAYINAMRELSSSVNEAGKEALKAVGATIANSIQDGQMVGKIGKFALTQEKQGKYYIPFRPLVYGGDDVTFVCDGRIGLELAAIYLRAFEQQAVADGKPLTSRAGVCVVKTHYPFARAYKLSEELCGRAKKFITEERKRLRQSNEYYLSAIDWHLAASGLIGSLAEIRQREYHVASGNLAIRPLRLKKHASRDIQWRTWQGFTKVVRDLNESNEWKGRRNKVIALREVLRRGPEATKEFLNAYKIEQLPTFSESSGRSEQLGKDGWLDKVCGYFDAIEAMEFYISLQEEEGE